MNILSKHKRKGVDGFKRFVQNLESTSGKARENIVQTGLLEDPVYMRWVIPNLMTYNYIMKYNDDHVTKILHAMNNSIKIYIAAFFNTKMEKEFIEEKLSNRLKRDYLDEKQFITSINESQEAGARKQILQAMRKLQNSYEIPPYKWDLPPSNVLDGTNQKIVPNSVFKLNFENGKPALIGKTKGKNRDGVWQHFYPNGNPMAVGPYSNGVKSGDWKFLYSNRTMKAEGKYLNDNREGKWLEYDKEGEVQTVTYREGKKIE
ncbi:MAG: hypothetical protein OXB84_03565 [Halobacteriovoraceae bacterium]|nr:hypothetical protein [Halobacteriovoraceae bacterium]